RHDAEGPGPESAEDGISPVWIRLGLCAGSVAFRRVARSLWIEARLRHRNHLVVDLRISHRFCGLRGCERGLHRDLCFEDLFRTGAIAGVSGQWTHLRRMVSG